MVYSERERIVRTMLKMIRMEWSTKQDIAEQPSHIITFSIHIVENQIHSEKNKQQHLNRLAFETSFENIWIRIF